MAKDGERGGSFLRKNARSAALEYGKPCNGEKTSLPLACFEGKWYNLITEEIPAMPVMVIDFEPQLFIRDGASVSRMSGPLVQGKAEASGSR